MKRFFVLCAALAAFAAVGFAVSAQDAAPEAFDPAAEPKVIYGSDDRIEPYQIKGFSAQVLRNTAASTVAVLRSGSVQVVGGKANLATSSYAKSYNLCKEEPFYEQQTAAFCSGSLVASNIIMTAGHCVRSQKDCEATKFVFGFAVTKKGQQPISVPASEVYGCAKLLGRQEFGSGADWALIQLDRRVNNHMVLKISRTGDAKVGTKIFVIGHPAGLPTKIAGGASVRDASPKGYFVANLDTYGGNSGSAVFNAASGNIEGILVRGEQDYETNPGKTCQVSKRCPNSTCRGEDVTKISVIADKIPMRGFEPLPLASRGSHSFDRVQELGSKVFQD